MSTSLTTLTCIATLRGLKITTNPKRTTECLKLTSSSQSLAALVYSLPLLFTPVQTMLTPVMNADSYDSDTLSMWHMGMSDAMRMLDLPWQATINKTDQGYDRWLAMYLSYVEKLND